MGEEARLSQEKASQQVQGSYIGTMSKELWTHSWLASS